MAYTDYLDRVQEIYIGYYQRPADPEGLLYWAARLDASSGNLDAIIADFAYSPESLALYGTISPSNIDNVINQVYESFFGRVADAEGLAFYHNGFTAGTFTAGTIMLNILDGAKNDDAVIVANKVEAANNFIDVLDPELDGQELQATYEGGVDAVKAREWLADVGFSPVTIPNDSQTTDFISHNIADYGDPLYPHETDGTTFTVTPETAAGADVMRITGDQDVRIDFTNRANQIVGLDLDGDGVIEQDGHENNISGVAANYEIVDAYARNPLNQEIDITHNFLGDIAFDGTGFEGDGVSTDGNIFLGGLGMDVGLGGIGNDFMAGGGISQAREAAFQNGTDAPPGDDYYDYYYYDDYGVDELYGGRNADFFFAELSRLDTTDGNNLYINGGFTSDDGAVADNTPQDTDWLLLEVSDDEDGAHVDLRDEDNDGGGQHVETVEGSRIYMDEIENIDASGNLYGFLDDVDVALGGNGSTMEIEVTPGVFEEQNVGIGSSSQLEIFGSIANNTLVGGYDNDRIYGEDGNDLLMGGNLNFLNNPNMLDIPDNGMDELYGGDGNDSIVFEADGGIIDGDGDLDNDGYDYGDDTLYVTREALGAQTAAEMLTDGVLRFELENGDSGLDGNDTFAGYGGADVDGTADQTNYVDSDDRVTISGMENVIATGMGAVDYLAAGTNDPELLFANQQNHFGYTGDLDLRGTAGYYEEVGDQNYSRTGNNILYANTGDDIIEGREGNDLLSGGDGRDDFYFQLDGDASWEDWGVGASDGDGVDVIHRQADANGDNIWDGGYTQDFGIGGQTLEGASYLTVDFNDSDFALPGVAVTQFDVTVDGELFSGGNSATLSAFTSVAGLATYLNSVFNAQDDTVSVTASGDTVIVTKVDGGVFGTDIASGTIVAGVATNGLLETQIEATNELDVVTPDRLIFKSYEDRSDNEGVDDDAVTGSSVTLGRDAYAEDLVVNFASDGTRIAEDQAYTINFDNLTTEDVVTINVNGVTYQLQVGVSIDGTQIDDEDGVFEDQDNIQEAFLGRFAGFINSFMDDDTAAGSIGASATATSLTITQNAYSDGEETVFMIQPVVTIQNLSGGEKAAWSVVNVSDSEIHLLDYAGRNNNSELLTEDNVLFIGEEGVEQSRAVLATAETAGGALTGSDALVINGGVDDLTGVVHNLATDNELQTNSDDDKDGIEDEVNGNFVVHGDDYLIGGTGNDVITGGTGDDRIRGSLGTDAVDGGKDLYAVREVGETKYDVEVLNAYDAVVRDGETDVLDLYLLEQTEEADVMIEGSKFSPYFDDTLIFHQADFTAGATEFTINLNNYLVGDDAILLDQGGAGTVSTDVDGDGDFEAVTSFTNFEHIRTVSGVGNAVADDGQGNDTLILTGLSDDTGGASYDLTNGPEAGLVSVDWYDWVDDTDGDDVPDYGEVTWHWQDIMYVDGVENVIGGKGDDYLVIDETEAAKNNLFDGGENGLYGDYIEYENNFDEGADVEPTVTVAIETATDTDEVIMTGGRVGQTVATDTLISVEYIDLDQDNNVADGIREDDVLDVTNVNDDVVVDFVNLPLMGLLGTDENIGTVSADGDLLAIVENMWKLENVKTDAGDDTVLVADADFMSQNARADSWDERAELVIDTYLNYDALDDDLNRETVADMRANNEYNNEIPEARNFGQFTFSTDDGIDRVDYSSADDQIAAVVAINDDEEPDYVLVNGGDYADDDDDDDDDDVADDDGYKGSEDRVDALINVEQIAASQGQSIIDFTTMNQDVQISFQFDETAVDDSKDRLESLVRIADGDGNEIQGIPNFVEYYDLGDNDDVAFNPTAAWTRIEGSDFGEAVFYDGSEDLVNMGGVDHRYTDDVLNLRGGENNVSYFALETSIRAEITVTEFDAEDALNTGLISADISFKDGTDWVTPLDESGMHAITSYTSDNGIAAGSLKLEASQDAEDTVTFLDGTDKLYILGTSPGVVDVGIGDLDTMRLTGFEGLEDGETNDVYDMRDLNSIAGNLYLLDGLQGFDGDHDTIKVYNDAADDAYNGGIPGDTTINLEELNTVFEFDFDVLDVTGVTETDVTTLIGTTSVGPTDEVVLGAINNIAILTDFESVVLTDATLAQTGETFVLDTMANTLTAGAKVLTDSTDTIDTVSFRGLVLEDGTIDGGQVANVSSDVTFSVLGSEGVTVYGGDGDDTITGGGGNDTFIGGAGADVLDGGIGTEVRTIQLDGIADATVDAPVVTMVMGTGGVTLTVNEVAAIADTDATDGNLDVLAGSGSDAIGAALATLVNANLADINAVVDAFDAGVAGNTDDVPLLSASFDATTDLLTFTFVSGKDVLATDAIVATETDTGTSLAISTDTTISEGGNGGADVFEYLAASESTQAAMDQITGFTINMAGTDDVIDLTALALESSTLDVATTEAATFAALLLEAAASFGDGNTAFVGWTDTDAYMFVDANEDGGYSATNDMVIKLAGIDDLTGFDANNVEFGII